MGSKLVGFAGGVFREIMLDDAAHRLMQPPGLGPVVRPAARWTEPPAERSTGRTEDLRLGRGRGRTQSR